VKIWLKEGGIQDLFDKRLAEVKRRDEQIERIRAEADSYLHDMNKNGAQVIELRKKVKELECLLEEISGVLNKRTA
jgi:F0F1-type ATP synthase membrane subunit b/b'